MELKLAKSTLSQANAKNKVNVAKISYEDMLKKCAQFSILIKKIRIRKCKKYVLLSKKQAIIHISMKCAMVLMKQVISMNFILSKIIESIHLRQ